MKPPDRDDLLWRLGLRSAEDGGAVPEDALLSAYRRGELEPAEARRVERLLAASPAARERLAELAGRPPEEPPAEVRERFLETIAAGGRGEVVPVRRLPVRRGWTWAALAAAALLALAAGVALYRQLAPLPLPPDLAYQVAVTGLAPSRSGEPQEAGPATGPAEALPDTVLRIAARPVAGAVEEVEVGLYRRRGGLLQRVRPGPRLTLETDRGSAFFEARAGDLLGDEPGVHELYLAVARPGDLPSVQEVVAGDPVSSLARGGRRRVHRATVVLRAPSEPLPSDFPEDR